MPTKFWTTDEAVALTFVKAPQIDYLVRKTEVITPAQPASRRGISRCYDFKNLVEIRVAGAMLNGGIQAREIGFALMVLRQHWDELRSGTNRDRVAVLAVFRQWRDPNAPPSVQIGPAEMLSAFAAYVIDVSVPVSHLVTDLEARTGCFFGNW